MTIIHFAHANGFPAKTYNKLFSFLDDEFDIRFIERHGHSPRFPVTDGWKNLRDELIEELERYETPVIGIGHSLGGILHFLAAVERPELYRQIILLDAPILSRASSHGLRFLKIAKLIDRFSPSQITRFRRRQWKSKEEALAHFKSKPKFNAFDEDVLRDYVEHGTVAAANGVVELFFDTRIEARIYRTIPHHLPSFRGKLSVPATYIGGTDSREGRLARLAFMKKHFPVDYWEMEGSHLFPFERPEQTAMHIHNIVKSK